MAKILSRYVKKNALFAIFFAVLGLWALQMLFVYLGELGSLSDSYTMRDALLFTLYRSPHYLQLFIPTGALLGAVVGLGLLANHSELIVMRASGVSVQRIVAWVLQPALLFVLLALSLNQFVVPYSNQLANGVNHTPDGIERVSGYWNVQSRWHDGVADGQDVIFIDYVDSAGHIGLVKRWHLDKQGNLQSADRAEDGRFVGTEQGRDGSTLYQWQLNDVVEVRIANNLSSQQSYRQNNILSLPIEPASVYLLTRKANDLSLTELYWYQRLLGQQGKRSLEHELAFWQKLLSPFAVLSLVILACSFVFGSLRTHSLGLRIVVSLLFGLLFSYLQDLVGYVSLATGWSPLLMVSIPIVLSAALGWFLLKRQY